MKIFQTTLEHHRAITLRKSGVVCKFWIKIVEKRVQFAETDQVNFCGLGFYQVFLVLEVKFVAFTSYTWVYQLAYTGIPD